MTQRKTSLPTNVKLIEENKWLNSVKKWTKKPDEGIVEIEKVHKLKIWLEEVKRTEYIEDLKVLLDWDNNKPPNQSVTGKNVDPYKPIRGEQYFIQVT